LNLLAVISPALPFSSGPPGATVAFAKATGIDGEHGIAALREVVRWGGVDGPGEFLLPISYSPPCQWQ